MTVSTRPACLTIRVPMVFLTVIVGADAIAGSKNPHHKSNYPPGEPLPIDGVWRDTAGFFKTRIDRGRAYYKHGDMVWLRAITRTGPGQYRAVATGSDRDFRVRQGERVTLSLVTEDTLVVRRAAGDTTLARIDLADKERFLEDFRAALRLAAEPKVVIGAPAVEISRLVTRPPVIVGPGADFDLELDFVVTGMPGDRDSAPVVFTYGISRDGQGLFESEPTVLEARPGVPQSRSINLTATETPGSYHVEATLKLGGATATAQIQFEVGDPGLLLDRLAGSWEGKIPGWAPEPFRLVRRGAGLALTSYRPNSAEMGLQLAKASVEIDGDELVITKEMHNRQYGFWFVIEDRLELEGGDLTELRGTSTLLDGSKMLRKSRGRTHNITYRRKDATQP